MSDKSVDLARGDGDTDDAVLVGRKIADTLWSSYVKADLDAKGGPQASRSSRAICRHLRRSLRLFGRLREPPLHRRPCVRALGGGHWRGRPAPSRNAQSAD